MTGRAAQEGLDELRLSPKDVAQLEAMGITTLEQLAQTNRSDLGMGKSKGDGLITRAQNILAIKHLEEISAQYDLVRVQVDLPSPGVIAAVKGVLNVYDDPSYGNCLLKVSGNSLLFTPRPTVADSSKERRNCGEQNCTQEAIVVCLCHATGYCQKHSEGHNLPLLPKRPFDQLLEKAAMLEQRLHQKREKALSDLGITLPEDSVRSFGRERGFQGFWGVVFSEIQGQDVMKKALTVAMFSPPYDPVHTLVIGEPASAKTLARDMLLQNFSGLTPVGGNATRAGLVCNRSTGELGALGFSDGKTVLVDEFDKIDPVDLSYCLELLSNGRCDIHSAKMHETIESRFTMIAFANPEGDIFSGDLHADIGMRPTVMSRFALVVKVRAVQGGDLLNLFRRSLENKGELKQVPQYFDQWLKLGRLHKPQWSASPERQEHYLRAMVEIVERFVNTPLRRDIRMKDYLRRVPESMARVEFSPVEDRHLQNALELFQTSLETWG